MRTLIQSRRTKSFFDFEAKRWIDARGDGTIFNSEAEAIRACMREGLDRVQFVILREGSCDDFVVPYDSDSPRPYNRRLFE